jgi:prepilin-type processing-associated H-X9-DG protein
LIEIVVVCALIALLIALIVPMFQRTREAAKLALCMTRLHDIGHATEGYAADSFGALPSFFFSFSPGNSGTMVVLVVPKRAAEAGWSGYDPATMICPADKAPSLVPVKMPDDSTDWRQASYGYNIDIDVEGVYTPMIKSPTRTALFYDGVMGQPGPGDTSTGKVQGHFTGSDDFVSTTFRPRHLAPTAKGNVLFADWHIELRAQIEPQYVFVDPTSAAAGNGNGNGNGK